jgi:hypothetical protein
MDLRIVRERVYCNSLFKAADQTHVKYTRRKAIVQSVQTSERLRDA